METLILIAFWVFIAWVCWRLFLRNWVMSRPIIHAIQGRFFARKISDEVYYAQAAHEVKNKIINEGLWVKAWSDAQGDDLRAQAIYIKYRVEELQRQTAGKFSEYAKESNDDVSRVIIPCPHCGANLRVAAGKFLDVHCPECDTSFRVKTAFPVSSYGRNFARYIYAVIACAGIVILFLFIIGMVRELLRHSTLNPFERTLIITEVFFWMIWSCISTWKVIVK